ncbi:MAG TPA: hypothetical protein VGB09_10595 [Candidatus Binatia bacterium]
MARFAVPTNAQTKMEKLHVGYSAQAGSLAPIWITKEAGIFKKHDLDVDLLFIPGGPTAAAALMTGEVPSLSSAGRRSSAAISPAPIWS